MLSRKVLYHILGWTVFVIYETGLFLIFQPLPKVIPILYYYPVYFAQFYVITLFVYRFAKERPVSVLAGLLPAQWLLFAAAIWTMGMLMQGVPIMNAVQVHNLQDICRSIWRSGYFTILASVYWYVQQHLQHTKENSRLQHRFIAAQNAYLRAQVNPHLLFNTLNFIYHGVLNNRGEAAQAVALLSETMQYAVSQDSEDQKAPLLMECEQLEKLVALYRLRHPEDLVVWLHIDRSGMERYHRIPALLLITFVENMFKHGDLQEPLTIDLYCDAGFLYFRSENKITGAPRQGAPGTGLNNARTRLESLYAEADYNLVINENQDWFTVKLKLRI